MFFLFIKIVINCISPLIRHTKQLSDTFNCCNFTEIFSFSVKHDNDPGNLANIKFVRRDYVIVAVERAKPRISMTHVSEGIKSKSGYCSCNQRFLEVTEKHKLRKSARLFDSLTRIRLPRRLYSRDWRAEIISSLQRQRAIAGAEPRSCTPRSV